MMPADWVLTTLIVRLFADLLIVHNLFTMRLIVPANLRLRLVLDCAIFYFIVSAVAQLLLDLVNPASASLWVIIVGTPTLIFLAGSLIRANRRMSHLK